MTVQDKIVILAQAFPCLREKISDLFPKGGNDWNADILDRESAPWSSGEKHAVRFVLGVWNWSHKWKRGKFDLMDAMAVLDPSNRAPIIAWCQNPWWC